MKELLIIFLIVITEPYKDIDYRVPNLYLFKKEYQELTITEVTPEPDTDDSYDLLFKDEKVASFDYLSSDIDEN